MPLVDPQLELTPREVARRAAAGEVLLVDVREPYEHAAGHIAGALHVPLERLPAEAERLAGVVVFYCRVGARSALATQAGRASGLEAYNLAGGLVAWAAEGLPLEPRDGQVAAH